MNWPSIGRFHLTTLRVCAIAALLLDIFLTVTGRLPLVLTLAVLVVWGGVALIRLALRRTQLIWRLQNRLIVTYLFMGISPIVLILGLFFVLGWLLTAQFAGYLLGSAVDRRETAIETPARLLARSLPEDRIAVAQQLTATGIGNFEALVVGGQEPFRYPADAKIEMPSGKWDDYTGVAYRDGNYYLMSLAHSGESRALILVPLDVRAQTNLVPGLGTIRMPLVSSATTAGTTAPQGFMFPGSDGRFITFSQEVAGVPPPAWNVLDVEVYCVAPLSIADWNIPNSGVNLGIFGGTRLSAVLNVIYSSKVESSELSLNIAFVLTGLLGCALILSIYIGVSMTRTLTGTFSNLYDGTTLIGKGEFTHRIPVMGRDQLADLGHSFNKMAGQLEQFVTVTREKERLQSEVAIASEVQTRLFPHKPPVLRTVQMLGVCHAARSVSGDYYDYFMAADGELAIGLGDVAGKGISAALLMASIQSIMRTQLSDSGGAIAPASSVARLNRLLYASTSPEKYATFFFGLYNEDTRRLTYTNAGHLPPLLVRGENYEFLEVTGSVVGAFPILRYEEESVAIGPGDLLIAYTDGITEPENSYGEDFGADRLAEVVMRNRELKPEEIVEKILEAVRQWDTSEEQADDMTVLIVKGI